MTEHQVLTVGTQISGQNVRAEREEELFSLIRTQRTRINGVGLCRGNETDEEVLGYNWLLYLASENHKAPGLL